MTDFKCHSLPLLSSPVRPYSGSGRPIFSVTVKTSSKIVLFEMSVVNRYYNNSVRYDQSHELEHNEKIQVWFNQLLSFYVPLPGTPSFGERRMKIFMMIVDIIEQ